MCRNIYDSQMKSWRHRTHYFRTRQISLKQRSNWALPILGSRVKEFTLLYHSQMPGQKFRNSYFYVWHFHLHILQMNGTSDSNRCSVLHVELFINISHRCHHQNGSGREVEVEGKWKPP